MKTQLDSAICTKEELGLGSDGKSTGNGGNRFFKFDDHTTQAAVERYQNVLLCIKEPGSAANKGLKLWGNARAGDAR